LIKIKYKNKLNSLQAQFINTGFEKYANSHNLKTNYESFNFIAYEDDELAGILEGITLYDEIRVNNLIVSEKYRNKKIGTKLLDFVLEYFDSKKWKYISLCTYEFQAPKFYEKCGFELEYVRKNEENPKLTKYFFINHL
jgi:ribosomal protein S18 acetylase RimI-like enzyme